MRALVSPLRHARAAVSDLLVPVQISDRLLGSRAFITKAPNPGGMTPLYIECMLPGLAIVISSRLPPDSLSYSSGQPPPLRLHAMAYSLRLPSSALATLIVSGSRMSFRGALPPPFNSGLDLKDVRPDLTQPGLLCRP